MDKLFNGATPTEDFLLELAERGLEGTLTDGTAGSVFILKAGEVYSKILKHYE